MAGFSGSWVSACGHPVQPGSRFCSVCGQPVGAVEVGGGVPPLPGGQQPAGGQPAQSNPVPPAPPSAPALPSPPQGHGQQGYGQQGADPQGGTYYAPPTRPAFPPPQPEARWSWPPPGGAPAPPAYPPGTVQPAMVQPPTAGLPPTMQQSFGTGPRPWPQGPGAPQGPGETTATMPGMTPFGPVGGGPRVPRALGGLRGRLSGPRMPRPRGPVVPAVGVAALIVVVAAVIVAARGNGGSQTAGGAPAPAPAASSAPSQRSDTTQQRAATELAGLLPQSGSDRGDVNNAYFAVQACKALPADQAVFAKAADGRQNLLNKLGSLPDASALNPSMIQALSGAWTASAQADTDYANWAASLEHHCHRGKTLRNRNLKASYRPDARATADKEKFTRLWNPFAAKYGLPAYQPGQL